ncbi:MAG: hypothetical protein KatS3mg031_0681 [Chitinophagales bacterium]|nr:MAG: hypothetical protein KatS3mg031_0681 [Chitinophagales bacterium]
MIMDMWLIAGIIVFGLLIIMVEIFLVPGTTIIGVVGGVIVVIGVFLAFRDHGLKTGSITLALSAVATGVLLYTGIRTYSSGKFALKESITGKVNEPEEGLPVPGDEGLTVSLLRPNGKALINGRRVEVFSLGELIEKNTRIKVVKVSENKIYVKPITQ